LNVGNAIFAVVFNPWFTCAEGGHSSAGHLNDVGYADMTDIHFASLRQGMAREIAEHVSAVGPRIGKQALDARVMAVMGRIPRETFVPAELRAYAYVDSPIPIGFDKTVSQPFMIALMVDLLELGAGDSVLEVGTGLGYQAAILAELADAVYTLEIIEDLSTAAARRLGERGYTNLHMRVADGYYGWPEHAPFDRIMVTAAPELVPPPLIEQLRPGGRMVIPAGISDAQQLMLVEKSAAGHIEIREILPVRFAPLEPGDRA
jgi:protein-L-isoaspartate(D-aspartate) O-methyltransferase